MRDFRPLERAMAAGSSTRLDRRVVLKAGASLAAMAVMANRVHPVIAQEAPETRAGEFYPSANTGGFSAASTEPVVFQADFPFSAIAAHWSDSAGYGPQIQARFSADGSGWSDPVNLSASDHDAGRPDKVGRVFGNLVFPEQAQFVQYQTLDAAGEGAEIPDLGFTYIDATPGPTIDDVYAAATTPSLDPPPVISRAAWGANESYRYDDEGLLWPLEYRTVEHVIIHHTETPNFQDPLVAIRSVYYYHAVTRGWGDIGYNYLVDFMGNVYEGRSGGDNIVGGHAYEYAYGSSGIGTMGVFSDENATPEMQAGVVWITAWVGRDLNPHGRSDFHETENLATICAHRDVNDSSCPGDMLYGDLPAIRDYVSAVLYEGQVPGPGEGSFAPGDIVEVIVADANLRNAPGVDAGLVSTLPLGAVMTVQDGPTTVDGYVWFEISGDYGWGWCASFLLSAVASGTGVLAPGDVVRVATDAVNLRRSASLAGGIVAVLPANATGVITEGPASVDGYRWYRMDTALGSGWAAGDFFTTVLDGPLPEFDDFAVGDSVAVETDALNLRHNPRLSSKVKAVLPTNAELTITDGPRRSDGYDWYGVSSSRYGDGWCVAEFLTRSSNASGIAVGDDVRVIDGELNLRSGPGTSADVQVVLPDGEPLSVVGGPETANGYTWWEVSSSRFGTGWVAAQFIEIR